MNPPLQTTKRYWREPLTELVSVLDIGMSELIDPMSITIVERHVLR